MHTAHPTPADLMLPPRWPPSRASTRSQAPAAPACAGDVVALVFGEVDVGGVRGFSGGQEGGEALPERRCGGQVRR